MPEYLDIVERIVEGGEYTTIEQGKRDEQLSWINC